MFPIIKPSCFHKSGKLYTCRKNRAIHNRQQSWAKWGQAALSGTTWCDAPHAVKIMCCICRRSLRGSHRCHMDTLPEILPVHNLSYFKCVFGCSAFWSFLLLPCILWLPGYVVTWPNVGFAMANLGCQLDTSGKKRPHLRSCLHQIGLCSCPGHCLCCLT